MSKLWAWAFRNRIAVFTSSTASGNGLTGAPSAVQPDRR
jgi:hypothetical protein